jgi:hypothetical protein
MWERHYTEAMGTPMHGVNDIRCFHLSVCGIPSKPSLAYVNQLKMLVQGESVFRLRNFNIVGFLPFI